jgi:chromosome segregation ATPase
LFEIPRKKPQGSETQAPPPPSSAPPSHQVQHSQHQVQHSQHAAAPAGKGDAQMKYWEQKVKEHAAENLKLHQQLDSVTKHRDQLLGVLSNQQQGGAETEELRTQLEAESVNARQLEQQLTHLQQRVQEFNGKLAEKDQEIGTARQRSAALEHQLTQGTTDLARLRSELETQEAEHATAMAELRAQLTEAKQTAEIAESSLREQTARARDAASDLSNLRIAHHDLQRQWDENRKSFAELNKRNDELEQRLSDRVAEIQHLRSELDRRGTSYADEFALRARLRKSCVTNTMRAWPPNRNPQQRCDGSTSKRKNA